MTCKYKHVKAIICLLPCIYFCKVWLKMLVSMYMLKFVGIVLIKFLLIRSIVSLLIKSIISALDVRG